MSFAFRFGALTRRRCFTFLAAACVFALPLPRARASLVVALELPEMTAEADAIVVAKVTATRSWKGDDKTIFTEVQLQVEETWKGDLLRKTRTIAVVQPGGVVGDIEMRVHGLPSFAPGEEAVLFLNARDVQRPTLGFFLTALGQGKRPLFRGADGRIMAAPSDRSAAVLKDAFGRWQKAAPEVAVPLDDLRQQVRLLLGSQR